MTKETERKNIRAKRVYTEQKEITHEPIVTHDFDKCV